MKTNDFRIAAAQVASWRGDLSRNLAEHAAAVAIAAEQGISALIFPELSLTGYEPDLAAEWAFSADDPRLDPLRDLARRHVITLVAGAPWREDAGPPYLGAFVLEPDETTRVYAKMHLGGTEPKYFRAGDRPMTLAGGTIGLAICADASRPTHPSGYAETGATIYAAGVFLNAEWHATDAPRFADYAARFRMLVVMANHADSAGTYRSVGRSAVWAPGGVVLARAEGTERCLVIASLQNKAWIGDVIALGSS